MAPLLERFRALLAELDALCLAAMLPELGVVLYNREIVRWRVMMDISDELLDQALLPARARMTETMLRRRGAGQGEGARVDGPGGPVETRPGVASS